MSITPRFMVPQDQRMGQCKGFIYLADIIEVKGVETGERPLRHQ
jgi:hypothetical protein